MVLDAWIIDNIKRKEERRRDQDRPRVYIDISDTVPPGYYKRKTPIPSDRGVIIIPPTDDDSEIGTVINFATTYISQYTL